MATREAEVQSVAAIRASTRRRRLQRELPLYIMLIPAFIVLVLFSYYPLYGIIIAFKDYKPLMGFRGSPWVGFKHFERIFRNPDMAIILRNTVVIAVGKIITGQVAGVTFALLLNEVRITWFKRVVQSMSYLLHFLSWMIFGGMLLEMFSLNGLVNNALEALGFQRIMFLMEPKLFQPFAILTDTWKGFGWGSIIYLAALTNIDPTLYEAAAVDGATRWKRLWSITLPGIMPTIILLSCLSLGSVLNAGFEQVLVLYNPRTYETADIIDTYIYRAGILATQWSLGTAVGLMKSVVALVLISLSYYLAGKLANYRIF